MTTHATAVSRDASDPRLDRLIQVKAPMLIDRIRAAVFAVLALALCALGDFPPPSPAVTIDSPVNRQHVVFDEQLLGSWEMHDPDHRWPPTTVTFSRPLPAIKRYDVVAPWYFARTVQGRLFELDSHRVIELTAETAPYDTGVLMPARHFWALTLENDRLRVSLLSIQLGFMAQTGQLNTTLSRGAGLWILTGNPADVHAALRAGMRRSSAPWILEFRRISQP